MAQTIVTLCDVHLDDDEHRGVTLAPISLDGGATFVTVDLCQAARAELVEPLLNLFAEHGRVVSGDELDALRRQTRGQRVSANKRRLACPKCGQAMPRSDLRKHLPLHHGTTLALAEAELGHTLDGHELKHWCDKCGGGFSHGQGLAAHQNAGCEPPATVTAVEAAPAKKSAAKGRKRVAAAKA